MFLLYWRFTVLYILNKRFASNTKAFSVVLTHKNLFVCGVTHFEIKNQIVLFVVWYADANCNAEDIVTNVFRVQCRNMQHLQAF